MYWNWQRWLQRCWPPQQPQHQQPQHQVIVVSVISSSQLPLFLRERITSGLAGRGHTPQIDARPSACGALITPVPSTLRPPSVETLRLSSPPPRRTSHETVIKRRKKVRIGRRGRRRRHYPWLVGPSTGWEGDRAADGRERRNDHLLTFSAFALWTGARRKCWRMKY